jgi:riboflavin biosynthesis pyrimidine reductase
VQVVWYTAMSIDGRIAGPGDDMSFLECVAGDGEERDFEDFIAGVDAIVIGGGTLRWLHGEGHDLPHRGLPIWLVSHDDELAARAAAADPDGTPVTRAEGDLGEILDGIAAAGHARAWIGGGGDIAGQALAADRVDEVILTVAPTVLGAGAGVFDHADLPRRLFTLAECREYGKGSVRLRWVRDRPSASSPAADSMSPPIG